MLISILIIVVICIIILSSILFNREDRNEARHKKNIEWINKKLAKITILNE